VRLGDPEAQVILPLLAADLAPLLLAGARGSLPADVPVHLPVCPGAAVGIVLAARGYPESPKRGDPIAGLEVAAAAGALVFHAGTVGRPQGGYGTNGGRVLAVVGTGDGITAAREAAERAADLVTWDGQHRRHDIALRVPLATGAVA
jgi:phosphoribosylamine--glycine ligase